jgi:DNA transformation protein
MPRPASELTRLRNLGPTSAGWLNAIGVHTEAELRALGAVDAYRLLALRGYRPGMNLVYAIEGALRGEHWARLPPEVRERLRVEVAAPWDARALLGAEPRQNPNDASVR